MKAIRPCACESPPPPEPLSAFLAVQPVRLTAATAAATATMRSDRSDLDISGASWAWAERLDRWVARRSERAVELGVSDLSGSDTSRSCGCGPDLFWSVPLAFRKS